MGSEKLSKVKEEKPKLAEDKKQPEMSQAKKLTKTKKPKKPLFSFGFLKKKKKYPEISEMPIADHSLDEAIQITEEKDKVPEPSDSFFAAIDEEISENNGNLDEEIGKVIEEAKSIDTSKDEGEPLKLVEEDKVPDNKKEKEKDLEDTV